MFFVLYYEDNKICLQHLSETTRGASKQIDFVKNRVLVEVQWLNSSIFSMRIRQMLG